MTTRRAKAPAALTRSEKPPVLAVAGLDPSGGAGAVADALWIARAGAHPLVVVSCWTVQDTRGVRGVGPVPIRVFERQLDLLFGDVGAPVVKTGLLPTAAHVRALAKRLPRRSPLVVDPVLASSGGVELMDRRARRELLTRLAPRATLLTPNLPELEALTGVKTAGGVDAPHAEAVHSEVLRAAEALLDLGAGAVLVKGGHGRGARVVDVLYTRDAVRAYRGARLPGSVHGTGCALASTVAARLACGDPLTTAVRRGIDTVRRGIRGAWRLGRGRPLLDF
jgi:hydroxymethylpyrimidine/phosphomethylpyrimidine kinase